MERCDILLYTSYLHDIGGIETFVFQFVQMFPEYDIAIMSNRVPEETRKRVKVYTTETQVSCETLIMVRITDKKIPSSVNYKRIVRTVHACKSDPSWMIPNDADVVVHVSEASKRSFDSDGIVIHNPLKKSSKRALTLVSATRIPGADKGKNLERMVKLAKMLNEEGIPFIWLNFSDNPIPNAPKGMVNVGAFQDIQPYIARADYLVQLSDQEGFCYSLAEALINQTAVICTPFETTKELNVMDGVNGYVVPFDMKFDVKRLLAVPECPAYPYGKDIKKKWKRVLTSKATLREMVEVKILHPYFDVALDRHLQPGETVQMTKSRAVLIKEKGFGDC